MQTRAAADDESDTQIHGREASCRFQALNTLDLPAREATPSDDTVRTSLSETRHGCARKARTHRTGTLTDRS